MRILLALLLAGPSWVERLYQKQDPDVAQGNALAAQNEPDKALGAYEKAKKRHPDSAALAFDRAAALLKLDAAKAPEAASEAAKALQSGDPQLRPPAAYQLALAIESMGKPDEAIKAYSLALGLDPADRDSKVNLELLLRSQEERKKQQPAQPQEQKEKKEGKDQKDKKKGKEEQKQQQKEAGQKQEQEQQAQPKEEEAEKKKKEKTRKLPGSSYFPRHIRRRRHGCGYINRFLVFRKAPVNLYVIRKSGKQPFAFFQRLGRTFRRGDKSAELLQGSGLRVELVQPQKLSLLVDLQKPPLPVLVHSKINRTETNLGLPGKRQYSFLHIGRRRNGLHLDIAQSGILAPVEGLFGIVQRKRIHPVAHEHHADVKLLGYHLLIDSGRISKDFVRRQPLRR